MDINTFVQAITPALTTIAVAISGLAAYYIKKFVNSKISADQQEQILNVVDASVKWVEQISGVNVNVAGEEKFNMAKKRALAILTSKGIAVSEQEIDTLIEAFVHGLVEADKELV